MPFRHKRNYYREAIDCFCLRKSRGQKVRARLCVSSEQCERAANKKRLSNNQYNLLGETVLKTIRQKEGGYK